MPFFRRKTDKQKTSPKKTSEASRNSRPPSITSSSSSVGPELTQPPLSNGQIGSLNEARTPSGGRRPGTLLLRPDSVLDAASQDHGASGNMLKPQTPMGTSSRLSKTLQEVLHDKDALAYFIQYMGWREAEHIIKFWLDAGSFQASSWTRIRTHSLNKANSTNGNGVSKNTSSDNAVQSQGTGINTVAASSASSVTSPGHEGNPRLEEGAGSSTDTTTIRRTGTAEANLNLLSGRGAVPEGQCDGQGDCNDPSHNLGLVVQAAGPNKNTTAEAGPARFTETGAHGADPLSRGSLQGLRDDGASSSRDSGLGSSSPYLETAMAATSPSGAAAKSIDSVNSTTEAGADADAAGCSTGQTHSTQLPNSPGMSQSGSPQQQQTASHLDTTQETSFQEKLRRSIEKDAVSIYSKYISLDATHAIGITEELRNETISKICREDGQVDPQCFMACQDFVVRLMNKEYFQGFLQSDFHCKHQIDILTGSAVQLADVLYNEAALFYFMEYMEQEGAIDLLQCWLAIDNFQQQLSLQHGQYDGLEAQNDAMVIYDKYFSLQAMNPLGFDDSVRSEVECNICREGGPLPDCFVTAKRQVLRTIDKVYFPQFLTSDLYFKFLNELINTVHSANDLGVRQRRRAGSDASSEHSVGSRSTEDGATKNTLLAMDTSSMTIKKDIKKALTKINDDMRIDNTLFNAENLWMRPQAGNMTLGRINEVGQFISEFAPNPDSDKKKKEKTFFKKRKDEKTQEEMALQIAQMIIKDVSMATGSYEDDSGPGLLAGMPS